MRRGRSTAGTRMRNMRWQTTGTPTSRRTCLGSRTPYSRRSSRGAQTWRLTHRERHSLPLRAPASSVRPRRPARVTPSEATFGYFFNFCPHRLLPPFLGVNYTTEIIVLTFHHLLEANAGSREFVASLPCICSRLCAIRFAIWQDSLLCLGRFAVNVKHCSPLSRVLLVRLSMRH